MIRQLALAAFALLVLAGPALIVSGSAGVPRAEPAFSASFMGAYARGDLETADQVASPLYREEWTRRGFSLQDRLSLLPGTNTPRARAGEWQRFRFLGDVADAGGFGHLLYTGDEPGGNGDTARTVWRVDTEPDGRVIWVELVYLFSDTTSAVRPVTADQGDVAVPIPAELSSYHPRFLFGVHSTRGREGYYAIGLRSQSDAKDATRPSRVVFFAIDENGDTRFGAWTFGQPRSDSIPYGPVSPIPTVELHSAEAALRISYLASLP